MPNCQLCGEPMPEGEEMFNYHGYSGPCPKPTKYADKDFPEFLDQMQRDLATLAEPPGGGPCARARRIVEEHIAQHGATPNADALIQEIAAEIALAEIRGIDRAKG